MTAKEEQFWFCLVVAWFVAVVVVVVVVVVFPALPAHDHTSSYVLCY